MMHDIILIWVLSWIALFTAPIVYEIVLDWLILAAESISENFIVYHVSVDINK